MYKFQLFIILLFFVSDVYSEDNYIPKFKNGWGVVEKHILNDWHTSLIDVSKLDWMKNRGIVPPHNFLGIAKGHPTLFYWDNYFTNKGLLLYDSLHIYAENVVNNLLWEVDTIGFVPNANFNWGMTRSQPPYLALMVEDVYRKTNNKKWLAHAYKILKKEFYSLLLWLKNATSEYKENEEESNDKNFQDKFIEKLWTNFDKKTSSIIEKTFKNKNIDENSIQELYVSLYSELSKEPWFNKENLKETYLKIIKELKEYKLQKVKEDTLACVPSWLNPDIIKIDEDWIERINFYRRD